MDYKNEVKHIEQLIKRKEEKQECSKAPFPI